MPKFLIIANYTAEGVKGVLAKGGSARRAAVEKAVAELGGSLESFYFGFGEDDAYVTVDLPDNGKAAAVALNVAATGMVGLRTIVLLTPEEIDEAARVPSAYQPQGS
jgi:uncharacterized protein with GYD domain